MKPGQFTISFGNYLVKIGGIVGGEYRITRKGRTTVLWREWEALDCKLACLKKVYVSAAGQWLSQCGGYAVKSYCLFSVKGLMQNSGGNSQTILPKLHIHFFVKGQVSYLEILCSILSFVQSGLQGGEGSVDRFQRTRQTYSAQISIDFGYVATPEPKSCY